MVPPISLPPWWILCRSGNPGTKDANLERHHAQEEGRNGSGKAVLDIPETGEARMDKKTPCLYYHHCDDDYCYYYSSFDDNIVCIFLYVCFFFGGVQAIMLVGHSQ